MTVRDFSIRDKVVNLIVRRRRWLDLHTGKCFTLPYDDIKSENTRYSKEFVVHPTFSEVKHKVQA